MRTEEFDPSNRSKLNTCEGSYCRWTRPGIGQSQQLRQQGTYIRQVATLDGATRIDATINSYAWSGHGKELPCRANNVLAKARQIAKNMH